LGDWELVITSETDQQRRWTWQEFRALPSQQVTVDLHCVTVARFEEWVAVQKPAETSSREDPGGGDPWFDWCDALPDRPR
jgi:DMSO/TMAO reductase YedYZ molybdopterin-dependent catalytic subunit